MQDYINSEEFVRDFNEGNRIAFNAVYNKYFSVIYGFCLKLVRQSDEAEDIATDTFIKLYHLHNQFRSHANIRAFLYVTSRNACMDYFRYIKKKEEAKTYFARASEGDYTHLNDELDGMYHQVLKAAIEKLPQRQKEVIEKLYFEEIDHKTTAYQMDIKLDALYVLRSRAVNLLRELIHSQGLAESALLLFVLHYSANF